EESVVWSFIYLYCEINRIGIVPTPCPRRDRAARRQSPAETSKIRAYRKSRRHSKSACTGLPRENVNDTPRQAR
ncbi:hypothetical protein, partial [Burkholderia cenocepacia]|uniref:hypothetical protein n=1 Tax=Burkholderia cenocepacia TaxID=95486 RepID=UPI002861D535